MSYASLSIRGHKHVMQRTNAEIPSLAGKFCSFYSLLKAYSFAH